MGETVDRDVRLPDEAGSSSGDESAGFEQLVSAGNIAEDELERMLTKLYSSGKKSVILKAALGSRSIATSTDLVVNPLLLQAITPTKLQVVTFVIFHFREFLSENPADLLDFIVRYVAYFPAGLVGFVLDKLAKAERFKDLSNIRRQQVDQKIRHTARDLLDTNVGNINDPNVLAIIGAFGLDKAARRTAIERLAQSSGNRSYLSFIATTSADTRFPAYCDNSISELARRALQGRSS